LLRKDNIFQSDDLTPNCCPKIPIGAYSQRFYILWTRCNSSRYILGSKRTVHSLFISSTSSLSWQRKGGRKTTIRSTNKWCWISNCHGRGMHEARITTDVVVKGCRRASYRKGGSICFHPFYPHTYTSSRATTSATTSSCTDSRRALHSTSLQHPVVSR